MPQDRRHDSRPHFVIPYWVSTGPGDPGDDGDTRPVPSNVVWYLCEGIHASPYQPGERLDITVDVANHGGANSPSVAQVTVWWADPSTGFVLAPDRLIGYRNVPVDPRGGQATTEVLSKVIPASAPNHICLLARVSHQYDRAGLVVDPVNDRHWAQRNLAAVQAQQGVPLVFPFVAGNPLDEEAEFLLVVQQAGEERFAGLQHAVGADPVFGEFVASLSEDRASGTGGDALRLALGPREQREIFLHLVMHSSTGPGRFSALEISQTSPSRETVVGGLGVTVTTD